MSKDMFKICNKLPIKNGTITILDVIFPDTDEVMYKVHYFVDIYSDHYHNWGWGVDYAYNYSPTSEERIMTEEEIKQMIVRDT